MNAGTVTQPLTSRPVAHSFPLSYHGPDITPAGSITVGEFGKKFRNARESKELSLEAVSNVTKISARMLRAIEDEDFDRLPGGIFNKGFIRAYAKHLGLDSETAITEYLDCLRNAQADSHEGLDSNARTDPRPKGALVTKPAAKMQASVEVEEELPNLQLPRAEDVRPARKEYLGRPSSGIPWTLIYLIAIVIIAAAILWIRHSRAIHDAAGKPAAPASALTKSSPVPTSSAATTSSLPLSSAAAAPHLPASTHTIAPGVSNPANQIKRTSQDQDQSKDENKEDATMRPYATPTAKAAEPSAENLTLTIRASENSWISVTSDGQLATQEILIAPAHPKFHAARELVVRVGNAAGVSFVWNGEEFPPQGAESEAKTLVFDAQGMRASPADQATH